MSIMLRSRRGQIGATWFAAALREHLEALLVPGRARTGRADARRGAVEWIDVDAGTARGLVDGGADGLHEARIDVKRLGEGDARAVAQLVREHPDLPARMVGGDYPEQIEQELARQEISLVPSGPGDIAYDCACLDWPGPCRHVCALVYVLVEAVEENPSHLLTLRGLRLEDLLAPAAPAAESPQEAAASPASPAAPAAPSPEDPDAAERPDPRRIDAQMLDASLLAEELGEAAAELLTSFYRSGEPAAGDRTDPDPDPEEPTAR